MRVSPQSISSALLERVFYPVTAVVSLDAAGGMIELYLFDTELARPDAPIAPGTGQLWLLTNHPEGYRHLNDHDWRNIRELRRRAPGVPLRVFIAGEEMGCLEVEMALS